MVSEVERRTETAKRIMVSKRNHRRARDRALTRLSHAHKEEYLLLLEREKARDEELGKKWADIAGNTGSPITVQSYKDATEGAIDPSDSGENQSYYGGEE